MLDYRFYYHVIVTEEGVRSLQRERRLQAEVRRGRRLPEPVDHGPRRWNFADVVRFVVPNRWRRLLTRLAQGSRP